jgi:ribonuclease P protein component
MPSTHSFKANQKLKSQKNIQALFLTGKAFYVSPFFKVIYQLQPSPQPTIPKIGVSVSKKHFKKAVHRNTIKRQIRETYRTQNQTLKQSTTQHALQFFVLYTQTQHPQYQALSAAMAQVIKKLSTIIQTQAPSATNPA